MNPKPPRINVTSKNTGAERPGENPFVTALAAVAQQTRPVTAAEVAELKPGSKTKGNA